jgi:tetratricopeptide (TPR) repeat protein
MLGGGGAWLVQQQRVAALAHQRQTDQQTRLILERGRTLLEAGWQANDLGKLQEAAAEAGRAEDVARSGGAGAAVREEAEAFRCAVAERLGRARKDRELLVALLDVAAPHETRSYAGTASGAMMPLAEPSVDEQYGAAFRRWGLDVDGTAEAAAVARLRQEPEAVVQEAVAGLDAWMLERRRQKRPEAEWRRLFRLAAQLDGSGRHRELRALLVGESEPDVASTAGLVGGGPPWPALWELARGGKWRRLQELRGRADPATEPVLTVVLLARACAAVGDGAGAEQVLRQALAARPGELVLLEALGGLLERQGRSRRGEALECYRAARALRPRLGVAFSNALVQAGKAAEAEAVLRDLVRQQPDNPEMRVYLGNALYARRKLAEAVAAYRKAIALRPEYVDAYANLGFALADQGKLAEAVAACRTAIELKPDYAPAYGNLGYALRSQRKLPEALAASRTAIELQPDKAAPAYINLGNALHDQGKLPEAVAAYRKAIELQPDYALAYYDLGGALHGQGNLPEAVAACRTAIELQPDYAPAYFNLGNALHDQGKLPEAVAACRKAIELQPDYAEAYYILGVALHDQGNLPEAAAACRTAIELQPDLAPAYNGLGAALLAQGKLPEAVAAYCKAIELQPDKAAPAYINLGNALRVQGKLSEAVAAYRTAIELQPDKAAPAYVNLGDALRVQGKLSEAVAACHKAIALKPDDAKAHCNLGLALRDQGEFADAVASLKQGHDLGSRRPAWPYPSAAWVHQAERLLQLDSRLPKILRGESQPTNPPERVELAALCQQPYKQLYAAAARFYRDALAAEPKLAADPRLPHRYNAACAAALAGCGQGRDADRLDAAERARWREQARAWLRADLTAWAKLIDDGTAPSALVQQQMRHWQTDADLAGVREKDALAKLPEAERQQWQQLWADVDTLLVRAAAPK